MQFVPFRTGFLVQSHMPNKAQQSILLFQKLMTTRKKLAANIMQVTFGDDQAKPIHITQYLSLKQKREIRKALGVTPFILLDHYLFKINVRSTDFSDEQVAKEIDFSVRRVQEARQKLTSAGWFHQCTYKSRSASAVPMLVSIVGIAPVRSFKQNPEKAFQKYLSELGAIQTVSLQTQCP